MPVSHPPPRRTAPPPPLSTIPSATTYPAIVGHVLGTLRAEQGQPQVVVAAAAGVSQPTWSKIERGDSALTVEQLNAAAAALHTTPGVILSSADEMARTLRRRGVQVLPTRVDVPASPAFALVSAAALTALIIALSKKGHAR